ncbi:non-hydrolyzing UDP-N-acetylglucosamine 2-epimerase [Patescibacteria group bacterium]
MSKNIKISIIVGTRPETIKMASIIKACQEKRLNFFISHTNQHYSNNLTKIFFDNLELPQPKHILNVGSGTSGRETGKILLEAEKILKKEKPDIVLVEGDTNSVLAGALAASKLQIKVGHIEAGLRSYSREMPEEMNRILVDHCSDYLFVPTKNAKKILIGEGISKNNIFITGNTVVDAVYQNVKMAKEKSRILQKLNLKKKEYFLFTLHRPENVDRKERIREIFKGLKLIQKEFNFPIVFPIHPRTKKTLKKFNLKVPKEVKLIGPVGYLDFLSLEFHAGLVLTDSGGIQEETCILKVPCVTLRDNTERPETIIVGSNALAGTNSQKILTFSRKMIHKRRSWKNPFGDGKSGKRIIDIILNSY